MVGECHSACPLQSVSPNARSRVVTSQGSPCLRTPLAIPSLSNIMWARHAASAGDNVAMLLSMLSISRSHSCATTRLDSRVRPQSAPGTPIGRSCPLDCSGHKQTALSSIAQTIRRFTFHSDTAVEETESHVIIGLPCSCRASKAACHSLARCCASARVQWITLTLLPSVWQPGRQLIRRVRQ